MPQFTMRFDLGHLITVVVMALGFFVGWGRLEERVRKVQDLEVKLAATDENLRQTREKLIEVNARLEDYRAMPCPLPVPSHLTK